MLLIGAALFGTLAVVSNRVAHDANVDVIDDLSTSYEQVDEAARQLGSRIEADERIAEERRTAGRPPDHEISSAASPSLKRLLGCC